MRHPAALGTLLCTLLPAMLYSVMCTVAHKPVSKRGGYLNPVASNPPYPHPREGPTTATAATRRKKTQQTTNHTTKTKKRATGAKERKTGHSNQSSQSDHRNRSRHHSQNGHRKIAGL